MYFEQAYEARERFGFACQRLAGSIRLFRHARVLLGALVHLCDRLVHLLDAGALLRGRLGDYPRSGPDGAIKVMATYHPAYLLRNPGAKKDVWEDMKVVRELLARERTS